jgi:Spy/CpxP family protein refolding chaperone
MRSYISGAAILMLAATTFAAAQPETGRRVTVRHGQPERMDQLLNLSSEQEAKIKKLRTDMQRLQVQHRSKVEIARIDLRELMDTDAPDRGAIEKKVKEIGDLQVKQRLAVIDHGFEVEKLLTPEQKKIWREHRAEGRQEVRQRMMRKMGTGNGGGPDVEREIIIQMDEDED